jgi:hypothetical protein
MTKLFFFSLLALSLTACHYRLRRYETEEEKRVWLRYYPDPKRREAFMESNIFKYRYEKESFSRIYSTLTPDTGKGSRLFKFDSTSILLSETEKKYHCIFSEGLLYPKMIWCSGGGSCLPFHKMLVATGEEPVDLQVRIRDLHELTAVKHSLTTRRFRFNVTGEGGFTVYFFELTNENATKNMKLEDFIKSSHATFLEPGWSEI